MVWDNKEGGNLVWTFQVRETGFPLTSFWRAIEQQHPSSSSFCFCCRKRLKGRLTINETVEGDETGKRRFKMLQKVIPTSNDTLGKRKRLISDALQIVIIVILVVVVVVIKLKRNIFCFCVILFHRYLFNLFDNGR